MHACFLIQGVVTHRSPEMTPSPKQRYGGTNTLKVRNVLCAKKSFCGKRSFTFCTTGKETITRTLGKTGRASELELVERFFPKSTAPGKSKSSCIECKNLFSTRTIFYTKNIPHFFCFITQICFAFRLSYFLRM